jgi:DNA-directed RNA polymerase specialized sigma24 family protein
MSPDGSISRWIEGLKAGDASAAGQLWARFARRLGQLARPQSRPTVTGGAYDEEDVALSAFANFCSAVQGGHYPDLQDRDELWRLLATITLNKARDRAQQARALKRGGGATASPDVLAEQDALSLDLVASSTSPPDLLALMKEECQRLFGLLQDPELEAVVLYRLEGCSNDEIAQRLGCARRTVQRMLALIRRLWENAQP